MALFQFEWAVDQHGYDPKEEPVYPFDPDTNERTSDVPMGTVDAIHARGGPLRFYRPLEEHPGLWLRFAHQCDDIANALTFVTEFGVLSAALPPSGFDLDRPLSDIGRPEPPKPATAEAVPLILGSASFLREIAARLEREDRTGAADYFSRWAAPELTAGIQRDGDKYEPELIPRSLDAALKLQALQAITGAQQWRRCRNSRCPNWIQIGAGAYTARREFCSTRCRVSAAAARKGGQHV
jgi:hypothetical protein